MTPFSVEKHINQTVETCSLPPLISSLLFVLPSLFFSLFLPQFPSCSLSIGNARVPHAGLAIFGETMFGLMGRVSGFAVRACRPIGARHLRLFIDLEGHFVNAHMAHLLGGT